MKYVEHLEPPVDCHLGVCRNPKTESLESQARKINFVLLDMRTNKGVHMKCYLPFKIHLRSFYKKVLGESQAWRDGRFLSVWTRCVLRGPIDRVSISMIHQNSATVQCRRKHIFRSPVFYSMMLFQHYFPGSNQGLSMNPATHKGENVLKQMRNKKGQT